MADVSEPVATMAPEEEISFSDDSFQSLPSSSSTLIEDTMMTAASSLEDLVVELSQAPVLLTHEVDAQLPEPGRGGIKVKTSCPRRRIPDI